MIRPHRRLAVLFTAVASVAPLLVGVPVADAAVTWTRVGVGITQGISGIAASPAGGWVVVRDNKSTGQNRVALLDAQGAATPLSWPGSAPQDLEAIDAVPSPPGRYAVVTSAGAGRVISVTGRDLVVLRSFTLPTGRTQNEGFALTRLGTTTVAVWGNRGDSSVPGRLYAATFDVGTGAFGAVTQRTVTVPYPTTHVRHISDVKVLAGRIVVSSASDNGDNGPFDSALYAVGTAVLESGRVRLTSAAVTSLARYPGHKIEGLACNGSTGILSTDDENLGGWVARDAFCG